jgi:hypothetical protein
MPDATIQAKVRMRAGGDELDVAPGGKITNDGTQAAALAVQLTAITHTAAGTADYAIQDLVQNTGFGFVTKDEGNTVLAVIANLQARCAAMEAALEGVGIVAAN